MRAFGLLLVLAVSAGGCVLIFQSADIDPIFPGGYGTIEPQQVDSALRVHLDDGSVAVFPLGAIVTADSITGAGGQLVAFPDRSVREVVSVGLDRVIGAEVYSTDVNVASSLLATVGASAVSVVGLSAAAVAIFGSCPTVYAVTPDSTALEAELFSNSIAPLFEMRDRDVLRHAVRDADGAVRLEIRNEALETHYVDHLALEAVDHAPGERAVPSDDGRALVLGREAAPTAARDRTGRDVRAALAVADGGAYETADAVTEGVTEGDLTDTVTLTFPRPDADSVAVALRFRSSLLTTVLLYEHMLGGQGARGLDWIGQDMASIGSVAEFGDYYLRRLGLRVEVEEDGQFREVARVAEAGPLAWADRAVVVPVPDAPTLRVRLRFVAGGWQIDRATAAAARTVRPTPVPLAAVADDAGRPLPDLARQLGATDREHAVRGPGSVFTARFVPPAPRAGRAQTLFVSAQGHYIEWMRPDWLRRPDRGRFQPSDSTLVAAIGSWRRLRSDYQARFDASRIPVR